MICLYSWSSRTQPSINKTVNCGWCVIGGGAGGEHQHQHGLHAQSDVGAVQVRNQDHKHSVLDKSCIVADLNLDECICGNIIIVKVQNLLSPPPESPDWLSTLLWSQVTVSTGSLLFEGSAPPPDPLSELLPRPTLTHQLMTTRKGFNNFKSQW